MLTRTANRDSRLSFWPRVREFAVPPSMIETATGGRMSAAGQQVDSPRLLWTVLLTYHGPWYVVAPRSRLNSAPM
ncbi:hypothetical protein BKD26_25950 [Streptomyces sp. CB03238]|nr:hypothetical protein BKD26_25950 [Streptomyces sp. CB03238]